MATHTVEAAQPRALEGCGSVVYHLYQGFSAGVGNIIMGVVFAWFYQRTNKIWPLVIAHFLIDAVAFVGYAAFGESLMGFLRQE